MIFEIRGCCSCKFTWKKFDMSIKNVMLNLMVMGVVFNPLTLRSNLEILLTVNHAILTMLVQRI